MKKSKPSAYLDTTILSALHFRGRSLEGNHRKNKTREWWKNERRGFGLVASRITKLELEAGAYPWQQAAVAEVARLPFLPVTREVNRLAGEYLRYALIPQGKRADALHLAICTVFMVDYLVTWNFAHLANAEVQARLIEINARLHMRSPWLVSPESIPKRTWGQDIRRKE